jgi:hypothetical protein
MVRQFEWTRRSHLVVALSLATAANATEEESSRGAWAGSLARALLDARNVAVVVSEDT